MIKTKKLSTIKKKSREGSEKPLVEGRGYSEDIQAQLEVNQTGASLLLNIITNYNHADFGRAWKDLDAARDRLREEGYNSKQVSTFTEMYNNSTEEFETLWARKGPERKKAQQTLVTMCRGFETLIDSYVRELSEQARGHYKEKAVEAEQSFREMFKPEPND